MGGDSVDRNDLSSRTLPFMKLSDGSEGSRTAPPPPLPKDLDAQGCALARFAVQGNVIITGGAGTLGLSAARALLEHGTSGICIWDLESTLRSSQSSIISLAASFPQIRIFSISVDVTSTEDITTALASTIQTFGGEPISHLFTFAGIVGCHHALEMTEAQFRKVLDVNTTGSFLCAQTVAKHMSQQPPSTPHASRSITLIASISGHRVNFPQSQVAYNVSKAAVIAMKNSLGAEWASHGIRVNSISPGYMDTILNAGEGTIKEARAVWASRNPMGRMGAVGELDGVCVLLASRAGSYINAADFVVDGGGIVF